MNVRSVGRLHHGPQGLYQTSNNSLYASKLSEQTRSRSPPVSQGLWLEPSSQQSSSQAAVGNYGNELSNLLALLPAAPSGEPWRWRLSAVDRRMLSDLCARPPSWSPGPNIDCLFLQAPGNREPAISLDFEARLD